MQRVNDPVLIGITKNDIQAVFEKTLRDFKQSKTRIIYLDASYLYNFHLDDFVYIKKLNLLMRRSPLHVREWHILLERWLNDQTVRDNNNYQIKPIQIERTIDRVVNEALDAIAEGITGEGFESPFVFRMIGQGVGVTALPSDQTLSDEIDRIDVTQNKEGGSLSRDGSTVYSVGNHSKSIASASVTECGMANADNTNDDLMFEHSVFNNAVTHVQDSDAVGTTSVIYMCSA